MAGLWYIALLCAGKKVLPKAPDGEGDCDGARDAKYELDMRPMPARRTFFGDCWLVMGGVLCNGRPGFFFRRVGSATRIFWVMDHMSVQSRLTEATFAPYLKGYELVTPTDLLSARGGRVRYAIDALDASGRVTGTQYRLGGLLKKVDPGLRFLGLFNPYAPASWTVQLATPGTRVRLYYMAPGTTDEIATMRQLLSKLEAGEIVIKKVRRSN